MFPWSLANYNFPFSGDVNQKIEPDWFFGTIEQGVGDSDIEKEIFLNVASYGRQIGLITEVVLALADKVELVGEEGKALSELRILQPKIEKVKDEKKERLRNNAIQCLNRLARVDPKELTRIIAKFDKKKTE